MGDQGHEDFLSPFLWNVMVEEIFGGVWHKEDVILGDIVSRLGVIHCVASQGTHLQFHPTGNTSFQVISDVAALDGQGRRDIE